MLKDGPVRPTPSEDSSGQTHERTDAKPPTPLSERLAKGQPTSTKLSKPSSGEPSLAEKLAWKAQADRAEVEALTRSELRRLGESLKTESENAVTSIENAMVRRLERLGTRMEQAERRQRLTPLWIGSGVIATVCAGLMVLWGASAWTSWSLSRDRAALETVRGEIASERQQLTLLRNETRGVRIARYGDGSAYLILPEGSEPNFECDGRTCVKLPPPVPVPNVRPRD